MAGATQRNYEWGLGSSLAVGYVIKHSPKFAFDIIRPSYIISAEILLQTTGSQHWHHRNHHPIVSIAYQQVGYNHRSLGTAHSVLPSMYWPVFRMSGLRLSYQLGIGVGYFKKYFDNDPEKLNNAIGSRVNLIALNGLQIHSRNNQGLSGLAGIQLLHGSNGNVRRPNRGLNLPAVYFGLRYLPTTPDRVPVHHINSALTGSPYGLGIEFTHGWNQVDDAVRITHPVYGVGIYAFRYLTDANRVRLGFEMDHLHAEYMKREWTDRASPYRYMTYLEDEILIGNLSVGLCLGLNVHRGYAPFRFYNRLTLRYYIRQWHQYDLNGYFGLTLKSHLAEAEYLAIRFGATWH
ncbi:MAG: acyloxyacyl hydrolase [Saprospiraceae bacterium]|nr:acyloxyacyl hydrolase [Saprospiraceae bacterium]